MLKSKQQPTRRSFLRRLALLSTVALLSINVTESQAETTGDKGPKANSIHASRTADRATSELQHIRKRTTARKTTTFESTPSRFSRTVIEDRAWRNGSSDDFNRKVERMHQLASWPRHRQMVA